MSSRGRVRRSSLVLKATCRSISIPNNLIPLAEKSLRSVGDLNTQEIDDYLNVCEKALPAPTNWNAGMSDAR